MTQTVKGRGVRIELGATYGAPQWISGISSATPPVVTTIGASGLANHDVGHFTGFSGMELDDQVFCADGVAGSTFQVPGLVTAGLSPFGVGYFVPVLSWLTLLESTSYTLSPATRRYLDQSHVLSRGASHRAGLFDFGTLTCNLIAMASASPAMRLLEAAAAQGLSLDVRITLKDGSLRVARGCPQWPGEDVQQGALGTSTMDIALTGFILRIDGTPIVVVPPPPGGDYAAEDYFAEDYSA